MVDITQNETIVIDVVGYPLRLAEEMLRQQGFRIRNIAPIEPPEDFNCRHVRRSDQTARFVVSQKLVDEQTVELGVVECNEL